MNKIMVLRLIATDKNAIKTVEDDIENNQCYMDTESNQHTQNT